MMKAEWLQGKEKPSPLEAQVVLGTFTNRRTYLPFLLESWAQFLSRVPLIVVRHDGTIREGMAVLRQNFLQSGRRYWVFLDDDIRFLSPNIVHDCVAAMIRNRWHLCTVYSTYRREYLEMDYEEARQKALEWGEREVLWVPGYFIMVDSCFCGYRDVDWGIPHPNTALDTTYTIGLRRDGYTLGLVPHLVYHQLKNVQPDLSVIEQVNAYIQQEYGDFYWRSAHYQGNVYEWGRYGTDQELHEFRELVKSLFGDDCAG